MYVHTCGPGTGGTQETRVGAWPEALGAMNEHSGTTPASRSRPPTAEVVSWDRTTRPYHAQLEPVHDGLLRPLLGRRARPKLLDTNIAYKNQPAGEAPKEGRLWWQMSMTEHHATS